MLRCSRKFSAGTTQKVPFPLHYNRIFRKLLKMVNSIKKNRMKNVHFLNIILLVQIGKEI